jgi:hypothetical protein
MLNILYLDEHRWIVCTADGGSRFLWNVDTILLAYRVSDPKRQQTLRILFDAIEPKYSK